PRPGQRRVDHPGGQPMTDLERLVAAWIRWEGAPASPAAADRKEDALAALTLPSLRVHATIAAHRRAGRPIPDAVQAALQETEQPGPLPRPDSPGDQMNPTSEPYTDHELDRMTIDGFAPCCADDLAPRLFATIRRLRAELDKGRDE